MKQTTFSLSVLMRLGYLTGLKPNHVASNSLAPSGPEEVPMDTSLPVVLKTNTTTVSGDNLSDDVALDGNQVIDTYYLDFHN